MTVGFNPNQSVHTGKTDEVVIKKPVIEPQQEEPKVIPPKVTIPQVNPSLLDSTIINNTIKGSETALNNTTNPVLKKVDNQPSKSVMDNLTGLDVEQELSPKAETRKNEILNLLKESPDNELNNLIFGKDKMSEEFGKFIGREYAGGDINFVLELKKVLTEPGLDFNKLKEMAMPFLDPKSKQEINISGKERKAIMDAIENKDMEGLLQGLKTAALTTTTTLVDNFNRFEADLGKVGKAVDTKISAMPFQKQMGEINRLMEIAKKGGDLSGDLNIPVLSSGATDKNFAALEKLNKMKQDLSNKFLPDLKSNDLGKMKESFALFKEVTSTKSIFSFKPNFMRGDISTVYKAYENVIKTMEKNPGNEMAKINSFLELDKQVKTFIAKNPDSGKLDVLKALSDKLKPVSDDCNVQKQHNDTAQKLIADYLTPGIKDSKADSSVVAVKELVFGPQNTKANAFEYFVTTKSFAGENISFMKDIKAALSIQPPKMENFKQIMKDYIPAGSSMEINIQAVQRNKIIDAYKNNDMPKFLEGLKEATAEVTNMLKQDQYPKFKEFYPEIGKKPEIKKELDGFMGPDKKKAAEAIDKSQALHAHLTRANMI